ncbi:MAG: hypothetical protein U0992_07715 [Planctomycetaceae bacterium]
MRHQLPALVSDIRWHHQPEEARSINGSWRDGGCDHVMNHVQQYEGPQCYDPAENRALAALKESGVHDAARRFSDMYVEVINGVVDASNMMPP